MPYLNSGNMITAKGAMTNHNLGAYFLQLSKPGTRYIYQLLQLPTQKMDRGVLYKHIYMPLPTQKHISGK
jgi:hypothetical protein